MIAEMTDLSCESIKKMLATDSSDEAQQREQNFGIENCLAYKKVVLKWIVKIVWGSFLLDVDPLQIYTVVIY